VITDKDKIDFYLISQKTTQGVAQPTHYYLAYDEMKVELDKLYTLIYKLSYLYYNWSGSIRVPSPCQYAKKLLILIGEKLSDKKEVVVPREEFENKIQTLYFI
jgi:aubergine-like protein